MRRAAVGCVLAVLLAACCTNESVHPIETGGGPPADAGPDSTSDGGGGSGGSAPKCQDTCKTPTNPCDFATCNSVGQCLTGHMPKWTPCGPAGACDGFGTCGPAPECATSADCDDGNECTIDVCNTFTGQCGHPPAGGHTQCVDGVCLQGGSVCCKGGCNLDVGGGSYQCVTSCPLPSACLDGFCL